MLEESYINQMDLQRLCATFISVDIVSNLDVMDPCHMRYFNVLVWRFWFTSADSGKMPIVLLDQWLVSVSVQMGEGGMQPCFIC